MNDESESVGRPCPPPPHLIAPPDDYWSVTYDDPLYNADFSGFMQVTIREADVATLRLNSNLPPLQEIGFSRMVLPAAEVDRIRALVRASDYLKYGHRGAMRPHTPMTILREGNDVSTFIPDRPPPESVTKVFRALEEVAKEIAKHPFKTLRGEANWTAPQIKRGEHVELSVSLRSVGSELIIVSNPLGSTIPTWTGLRLTVAKDKPEDQLDWEKDVKQIDLVPQNVLTGEGRLAKGQAPLVELPPNAELRLKARRKVLLTEGHYRGHVTFFSATNDIDGRVVGGSLTMDLGRLTITR